MKRKRITSKCYIDNIKKLEKVISDNMTEMFKGNDYVIESLVGKLGNVAIIIKLSSNEYDSFDKNNHNLIKAKKG